MSVRLRFKRTGRRHQPSYRLAAMDARQSRDSRVIEELGLYAPAHPKEAEQVVLKRERIEYWLSVGARPSDTVRQILQKHGILAKQGGPSRPGG